MHQSAYIHVHVGSIVCYTTNEYTLHTFEDHTVVPPYDLLKLLYDLYRITVDHTPNYYTGSS